MPRLLHTLPKYRKHRASGQAVVTLNGRDHYLGPHRSALSHREYDRLTGEWMQNDRQPVVAQASDLSVNGLCCRYLRFAKEYYRADGDKNQQLLSIKRAIKDLCASHGRIPANQFGPLALKSVRQRLIDAGLKRKTVNAY